MLTPRFALTLTAGALVLGTLYAAPAAAQIYRYTDSATGKIVISNQPPTAGAQVQSQLPSGTGPMGPASAVGMPGAAVPRQDAPGMLARRAPLTDAEWRWLEKGRVDYEVIAKLGEPAERRPQQTFERGRATFIREIWVYAGDDVTPTVLVWMVEGRVQYSERQAVR
jgi:Domain of unknown function (DUF4124)